MNTLPLVLSLALLTGCTKNVIDTPTGKVACYSRQCLIDNKEHTGWKSEEEPDAAYAKRVEKERRAWELASTPEQQAINRRAMERYLNSQSTNAYGCPGSSTPAYWSRSMGPYACGYRPY